MPISFFEEIIKICFFVLSSSIFKSVSYTPISGDIPRCHVGDRRKNWKQAVTSLAGLRRSAYFFYYLDMEEWKKQTELARRLLGAGQQDHALVALLRAWKKAPSNATKLQSVLNATQLFEHRFGVTPHYTASLLNDEQRRGGVVLFILGSCTRHHGLWRTPPKGRRLPSKLAAEGAGAFAQAGALVGDGRSWRIVGWD